MEFQLLVCERSSSFSKYNIGFSTIVIINHLNWSKMCQSNQQKSSHSYPTVYIAVWVILSVLFYTVVFLFLKKAE